MNLTRNHILSYRNEIAEICGECGFNLPEEYFLKVPPVVPDNYVAVTPQAEGTHRKAETVGRRRVEIQEK